MNHKWNVANKFLFIQMKWYGFECDAATFIANAVAITI